MEETLIGQHVPFHTNGSHLGGAIENRLILAVNVPQLQANIKLSARFRRLCSCPIQQCVSRVAKAAGSRSTVATVSAGSLAYKHQLTALSVGNISLGNVLVVSSPQTTTIDVDGLLPTILFHRIYISHSGGFAIFNPVTRFTKVPH